MDYRLDSFISKTNIGNGTCLTVKWYNNKKLLYRKTFYGTVNHGIFCLVNGQPFEFKLFKKFISNIINGESSCFNMFNSYGSYEAYEFDSRKNKLIINFGVRENCMQVYFDVNESMIDLLELMYNDIYIYYENLIKL